VTPGKEPGEDLKMAHWRTDATQQPPKAVGHKVSQLSVSLLADHTIDRTTDSSSTAPTNFPSTSGSDLSLSTVMSDQLLELDTPAAPARSEASIAASRKIVHRRLVVAAIAIVAVLAGTVNATSSLVLSLTAIAAPVATVVAIRRYRPRPAWPWWSMVVGFVLFICDGFMRVRLNTLGNLTHTRSIVPDLLALPGYGFMAATLTGFVRARSRAAQRRFGVVYDGVIAALALLAVSWVYLIQPVLLHRGTPISIRVILISYPAVSMFLLIVTFQIAFSSGHARTESERYLFASMFGLFSGDVLYMLAELRIINPSNILINLPYLVSYVAAAAFVLDPSMRSMTDLSPEERSHWSPMRIALVAVALGTPALLLLQLHEEDLTTRIGLFVTVLLLSGMAILQIVRALYDVEKSESQLKHQAMHDALTGLPNRRFMEGHLQKALNNLRNRDEAIGVLFLDLDRFKLINDTLGHAHGDALLIQVARRLQANVRPSDLVTRIGGDEFVVVLGESITVDKAREFANRLRRSLRAPFIVNDTEFLVSASIGLAFARPRDNANEVELLIRDADTAMYQAKEGGRDSVAVYEESMRTKVTERVELERDLRHAARRGELHLVYQPIVAMTDHQVLGMEALVRWSHPTLGVLLPYRFIHLAEETDLIGEIGSWVLNEALRQLVICRTMPGMGQLTVSVNLSVNQLRDGLLVQRVGRMLATHGLPGSALVLELTESEIMKDPDSAVSTLTALQRLGIKLAVDDFGTQYSSLAYLQKLPFDILKIDRSFVEPLHEENTASESLVAAIVAMANALGIKTVVEGVETVDQARRLQRVGCEIAQGFMYARPARVDQLADVLNLLSTRNRGAESRRETHEELVEHAAMVALGSGA
jgi:diguanylate cyclase (GGDEF)-like protein